jgi:RNA polymerase-binding transcription factor DksA
MVDLELSRTRLARELAGVKKRFTELKTEPEPEELKSGGDNTPLSEDADSAVMVEERELRAQLLSSLLDRAAALDEALERVERGTYGVCLGCQEPIPPGRLERLPEAAYCASCQAELEEQAPGSRPPHWHDAEGFYEDARPFED